MGLGLGQEMGNIFFKESLVGENVGYHVTEFVEFIRGGCVGNADVTEGSLSLLVFDVLVDEVFTKMLPGLGVRGVDVRIIAAYPFDEVWDFKEMAPRSTAHGSNTNRFLGCLQLVLALLLPFEILLKGEGRVKRRHESLENRVDVNGTVFVEFLLEVCS